MEIKFRSDTKHRKRFFDDLEQTVSRAQSVNLLGGLGQSKGTFTHIAFPAARNEILRLIRATYTLGKDMVYLKFNTIFDCVSAVLTGKIIPTQYRESKGKASCLEIVISTLAFRRTKLLPKSGTGEGLTTQKAISWSLRMLCCPFLLAYGIQTLFGAVLSPFAKCLKWLFAGYTDIGSSFSLPNIVHRYIIAEYKVGVKWN